MCRLGFISSLLSFIGGSALRMSLTTDLPPSSVKGLTCMLLAVLFGCISLFNATLIHYNNSVLNLVWRVLELSVLNIKHYLRYGTPRPDHTATPPLTHTQPVRPQPVVLPCPAECRGVHLLHHQGLH